MALGPKNTVFFAQKSVFSTLRPYNPLFWPHTDPTQWDHILPISSGNSGCLRFSVRCPFGRSAGRFLAPKMALFGLKMLFFDASSHPGAHRATCSKQKTLPIWFSVMRVYPVTTENLEYIQKFCLLSPKTLYFWLQNTFLSTLQPPYNSLFWPQPDPTQWDHIYPISWGNSGYLWYK